MYTMLLNKNLNFITTVAAELFVLRSIHFLQILIFLQPFSKISTSGINIESFAIQLYF